MKMPWPRKGIPRHSAEWLVVGLGNPGETYAGTRHNVGYRVINELSRRARVQPKAAGKTMAIAVGEVEGARVALVKPRTFMNNSGLAVRQALGSTGCELEKAIVVYDDLDLPAGGLRLRLGGGHGGNKGLKSIVGEVGREFVRLRIGIGRPTDGGEPSWDPELVAQWVLSKASPEDATRIDEAVTLASDAIEVVISEGIDLAGNRFNRR